MADITMCTGRKLGTACPMKDTCYRHTATPGMRQSMFVEAPFSTTLSECAHYWPTEETTHHAKNERRAF